MPLIRVHQLTRSVPDAGRTLTILDAVSFEIGRGETVAITGASGSGKSTLLGLLAGLDSPTTGTVAIDGQDLFALDEDHRAAWRAARVGFVFQSFQLLAQMTALENVMLPLELAGRRDADTRARTLLDRVGLGARLGHYPRTLSGGEQQRVALARAFAPAPSLLFADEPTGSLDHATGERIIDLMFDLNAESGATLVLVTHDPDLATRCERVLTIAEGQLVADVRAARGGGVRPVPAAVTPVAAAPVAAAAGPMATAGDDPGVAGAGGSVADAVDQPPGQPRVLT